MPASLVSPYAHTGGNGSNNNNNSWWSHIQPSAAKSFEQQWHRTPSSSTYAGGNGGSGGAADGLGTGESMGVAGNGAMPHDWSVFDDKKLQLGLQIITHASTFLRITSTAALQQQQLQGSGSGSGSELRAVNVNAVMEAFCICAALSQQLMSFSDDSNGGDDDSSAASGSGFSFGSPSGKTNSGGASASASLQWLRSPLPVQPSSAYFPRQQQPRSEAPTPASGIKNKNSSYVISSSAATTAGAAADDSGGKATVAVALLDISENLICSVHNFAALARSSGANISSSAELHRVLKLADTFPAHSFIRQVARWTKDAAV